MASLERAMRIEQTTDAMTVDPMRGGAFLKRVRLGVVGRVCHEMRGHGRLIQRSLAFFIISMGHNLAITNTVKAGKVRVSCSRLCARIMPEPHKQYWGCHQQYHSGMPQMRRLHL